MNAAQAFVAILGGSGTAALIGLVVRLTDWAETYTLIAACSITWAGSAVVAYWIEALKTRRPA